jgi:hypothetical protein
MLVGIHEMPALIAVALYFTKGNAGFRGIRDMTTDSPANSQVSHPITDMEFRDTHKTFGQHIHGPWAYTIYIKMVLAMEEIRK